MVVRCGSWIISFNISSPMRAIALVLACLACAGHGSREKEGKQIQDGLHAERSTTPSSHSLAELEQSQSIARGAASKPMKLLTMLLLALKDPADAFAPHATMPGEREVRSNLQFPAAPNSNFHGGLGRRARPPGVGDPGEGEGFLPDAGLFDDEDPAIQKSKFSSKGDQPQQQQSNVQHVERRRVLSSVLAAFASLNAPKPADAAPPAAARIAEILQAQVVNELIAELREAEDMVRDAKQQISENESQIEALTESFANGEEYPTPKLRDQDFKKKKNQRRQLERELELALSEEARVQKKLKVQAPESPS